MIDLSMLKFVLADSVQLLTLIALIAGPIAVMIAISVWLMGRSRRTDR